MSIRVISCDKRLNVVLKGRYVCLVHQYNFDTFGVPVQDANDQMKRIYHCLEEPHTLQSAFVQSVEGMTGHILLLGYVPIHTCAMEERLRPLRNKACIQTGMMQQQYRLLCCICHTNVWTHEMFVNSTASSNTFFVETLRRKHVVEKVSIQGCKQAVFERLVFTNAGSLITSSMTASLHDLMSCFITRS